MRLNADFDQRVVIRPEDYEWRDSPANGVRRMMLDRIGDEVARATTIVEFAPNSFFDAHTHDGGEEYLVLEGVFSDESGDYSAGHYVRNPIGTRHKPHTKNGARILVKLHQFETDDTQPVVIDTRAAPFSPADGTGLSTLALHAHGSEAVSIARFEPGTRLDPHGHDGGEEVFVLEGTLQDEHGSYPTGTWLRSPDGSSHAPFSDVGCVIFIKKGHLPKTS